MIKQIYNKKDYIFYCNDSMKQGLRYVVIGLIMTLSLSAIPLTRADFLDIPEGHPAHDAAVYFEKTGVIQGKADGLFHPEQEVTRVAFLKMLLGNLDPQEDLSFIKIPFPDVQDNTWFSPYVKVALKRGVIRGGSANFFPDGSITWFEAVQDLYRFYGKVRLPAAAIDVFKFEDFNRNIAPEDQVKVEKALQDALLTPLSDTKIGIYRTPTRGEILKFLYDARSVYQYSLKGSGEVEDVLFSKVDDSLKQILVEVVDTIHSDYLNSEDIDNTQLVYGALQGLVKSLKDPYSDFLPPDNAADYVQQTTTGDFEGIGANVETVAGQIRIVAPIKGSPAEKAGILAGDVITKVNGEETSFLTLQEAVNKIRGPKGTEVTLEIQRSGEADPLTIKVIRDKIVIDPAGYTGYTNQIAYFSLPQFIVSLPTDFLNSYEKNVNYQPRGIIIDLRNNPGGSLQAVLDLMSLFTKKGDVLIQLKGKNGIEPVKADEDGRFKDIPMVVLINKGSASASEVFAAGMKDLKRATIVGEKSFGKGVVQHLYELPNDAILKLTVLEWLPASGQSIHKKGLTPDIEVKNDPKNKENDLQLKKALEILNSAVSITAQNV